MGYSISSNNITLTRGDTLVTLVSATQLNGYPYVPAEGDKIRFAMKSKYSDIKPLIVKDIPIDTMELILNPEDTSDLNFGVYVYDIELTKANGMVDTFIKAKIRITEEVY